ncbi:MAG: hypothetical protein IPK15_02755 [Verrucomicrobia bacterium]|nr:hypothetical protein [Verrucomicrobiota bacterium]
MNDAGNVVEVRIRYAETNGTTISAPEFVMSIDFDLYSHRGPLYQAGHG